MALDTERPETNDHDYDNEDEGGEGPHDERFLPDGGAPVNHVDLINNSAGDHFPPIL